MKNFGFGTKIFNLYDPHYICKNHFAKVYYPWIHGTFHWPEEGPWKYCYNFSRLNEPVSMFVAWKVALQEVDPHEAIIKTTTVSKKLTEDKGKRNIVKSAEDEKS